MMDDSTAAMKSVALCLNSRAKNMPRGFILAGQYLLNSILIDPLSP